MKTALLLLCLPLTACKTTVLGLSRGDRLQVYGAALDLTGHPEYGVAASALGRRLNVIDKQALNVNPGGK